MSIYKFFYDYSNQLHITFIKKSYPDADTFFPIDLNQIKTDFNLDSENQDSEYLTFTRWTRK